MARETMKISTRKFRLYRTGEIDSMGRNVYRQVGENPQYSKDKGILLGQYFVGDEEEMMSVDAPYKEGKGHWAQWHDGEPLARIFNFEIIQGGE